MFTNLCRMRAAALLVLCLVTAASAQTAFSPPASPRTTYNFNPGWKFIKADATGAEAPAFDDSQWANVSTPHTWNDVDSFDEIITRGGEVTLYMGPAWYRKHFKLPANLQGNKIFLEFEGMRQAAKFWVNGKPVGKYENGVTATGVDITDVVNFGDQENVLSVWMTNVTNYREESSNQVFQWESKDFNPNYGGINQNVWLHVTGKVYQTLPLVDGLGTTGTYVYPTDLNLAAKTATVTVESQVKNESAQPAAVEFAAVVVDSTGAVRGQLKGASQTIAPGQIAVVKASGPASGLTWWSPDSPALYQVYSTLTMGGKAVDTNKVTTGFRKAEFKGGAGTGGVYINDKFTYLRGYAIRSTNEWAAVGGAYPGWLSEWDSALQRASNGNYIRWMHIAPKPKDSQACDRLGIVQICPAGDKEANPPEAQWLQRVEVMRKTMVYFRNSPSILFWEAGNSPVTTERLALLVAMRKELDPHGMRVVGDRGNSTNEANTANTPVGEFYGVMVGQDRQTEQLREPKDMFRAFSYERRDRAPIIETEDFRNESARRFWDQYTPPNFSHTRGQNDDPGYWHPNSEHFALATAGRYSAYSAHMISNSDPMTARWSGYASIIWADSNQHGRMQSSAVSRISGKVDPLRIPKQAFYVHRVMQSDKPDAHIIGHWNYPANTTKTMYVAASHADSVELFVNGVSKGKDTQADDVYIYAFPDVAYASGSIKAVAYKAGQPVAEHEIKTVGEARNIKLTVHTGANGLQADGSDVAFFDVEVVDAQGNRVPTDEARVDFDLTGPAIWRGGVNIGIPGSINNTYLNTECGINRVFIRSTLTSGPIKLTAKRAGLPDATITIDAKSFEVKDGLSPTMPQHMGSL